MIILLRTEVVIFRSAWHTDQVSFQMAFAINAQQGGPHINEAFTNGNRL
jgi:hypothetical protein